MKNYTLYTLFFYIYAGSFNLPVFDFTATMIKFIIVAVMVPPVAIYMLYKDSGTEARPSKGDVFITFLVSIFFIWIGYELSVGYAVPVGLGMIISFFFGIAALPIAMKVKDQLVKSVSDIVKAGSDLVTSWINKSKK